MQPRRMLCICLCLSILVRSLNKEKSAVMVLKSNPISLFFFPSFSWPGPLKESVKALEEQYKAEKQGKVKKRENRGEIFESSIKYSNARKTF